MEAKNRVHLDASTVAFSAVIGAAVAVATLFTRSGGRDVNRALVEQGRAVVYDRYCQRASYFDAEARARSAERGVWSQPGLQRRPWSYRHQQ